MSPDLIGELKLHKAKAKDVGPDDLVFTTRTGSARDRGNVRQRVLAGAVGRANKARANAGLPPLVGVTNHTLRRTFCSLLYETGASPAYVMNQMGHKSAALALEVYSRVVERKRDTGQKLDELVRGADWAQAGTNPADSPSDADGSATAVEAKTA